MSTLDSIAKSHGTDKSSDIHNYCVKYQKYLPFNRYDNLNIMEIGVLDGKSLLTWKDYFYRSQILGIDINPECKKFEESGVMVEIGSQYDGNFLSRIWQQYGPFDMILDDGSHMNEHVIFSFEHLFDSVKSGGVYIIEDVCTSYWYQYNGGYLKQDSMMEYFKSLTDDVNFRGLENHDNPNGVWHRRESNLDDLSKRSQPQCRTDIESINFLNGIIIITKR
jgi:hypothetical protein